MNIATKETAGKKGEELPKTITEGSGRIPAVGKSLSKTEQKQLLEHVRSLAK